MVSSMGPLTNCSCNVLLSVVSLEQLLSDLLMYNQESPGKLVQIPYPLSQRS